MSDYTPHTAADWHRPLTCTVCGVVDIHHTVNVGARKVCGECVDQLLALIDTRADTERAALAALAPVSRVLVEQAKRIERLEATVRHQAAKIQSMEGQWREFHAACDWLNEAMAKSRAEERKDWGDWRGCDADWVNGL